VSICMLNLLGSAVRGTGNMALPAGVIVASVTVHVIVSPLLIFGWGPIPAFGPAGAGWGLTMSFGAGSLALLVHLRSSHSLVTLVFLGVPLRWALFAEILKVGVPGLINVIITNLSVVLLTGIAGHLGRQAAVGYAMGARLEYILIPLGFGFGTAILAMVGTNWGAKQYDRAYQIAWTGGATVGMTCASIGLIVALLPDAWMGLFTNDDEIVRIGALYLRIVGPIYGFYGLGMALYFATQGFGSVIWTVTANAVRLLISAGCALVATSWLDLGVIGLFVPIAAGFCAYAALTCVAIFRVEEAAAQSMKRSLRISNRKEDQPMSRSYASAILAGMIGLTVATDAVGELACRPTLGFEEVHFSKMQAPTLERRWTAVVSVDTSGCAANSSGYFEIVFTRLKEIGPDIEFRERFIWLPPSVKVGVDFAADEAVGRYRIDNITPCPCGG